MRTKAILFDMDGVLVDSFEVWYQLFCSTLKHFGKNPIDRQEFTEHAWSLGFEVVSRRYFKEHKVADISDYYNSHFLDHRKYLKATDGVSAVLEDAKMQGLELAVISNTYTKLASKILTQVGLIDYFKLIIGGDKVEFAKPAPDMVLLACEQLGIAPCEAIMVGDTEYDIAAAREAGCLAVGYKTEGDLRIDSFGELLEVVASMTKTKHGRI